MYYLDQYVGYYFVCINAAMGLQKDGLTILGLKKKIIATENFEYYI